MAYNRMSDYYDLLTADQPYHKWKYIVEHFISSSENEILDIGCGTGTLTSQLTEYGQVSGVDISQEMLEIAESRNPSINWYCQDMRDLELPNQYDMITIFCDSLNYVTEPEDILQVFNYIDKYLKDEGIFIFDVHSIYKMNHQFNNQNYIDEEERLTLIWQAITGEEPNSVYHQMSFFVEREDGLYERFDEEHYQCTFEISLYEELLKLAGFEIKTKFTDFDIDTYSEQGDRQFIVAQKMNKYFLKAFTFIYVGGVFLDKIKMIKQYFSQYYRYILIGFIALIIILKLIFGMNEPDEEPIETINKNNSGMIENEESKESKQEIDRREISSKENIKEVIVDVKGAVKFPKTYEMKSSERINDVLKKAQINEQADLTKLNLSEKLKDQMSI